MPHIYAHRNAVPKTMRALAKIDPAPGLKLIEALVPVPGPGEVLVRVKKTALSMAALHLDRWDTWAQRSVQPPVIVGQEFVGLVASTGPGVSDFHPGELVIAEPAVTCGTCRHCLAGQRHLCSGARRLGQTRDGAFADYVCLPQGALWHAGPGIPTELLACFIPLGQAVRVARRFDLFGANVLVTGATPLGCMTAAIAHHAGARSVIGSAWIACASAAASFNCSAVSNSCSSAVCTGARPSRLFKCDDRLRLPRGCATAACTSAAVRPGNRLSVKVALPARARIGNDQAIKRTLFRATACKTNNNHGSISRLRKRAELYQESTKKQADILNF